jgi:Raf kinase inhibitor-like YbhB/YbcL family protein
LIKQFSKIYMKPNSLIFGALPIFIVSDKYYSANTGEEHMENLIISIDFDKQMFPKKYTCDGENVSPAIRIDRIHSEYLAITIEDWIGPSEKRCHWLIWNIKARDTIPENIPKDPVITLPFDAVQGTNDLGKIGYSGPCPPKGEMHSYYFNVYGSDTKLEAKPGATREELETAMKGHVSYYGGQAIATYQR